ncbi:biotin--[acetyl-CoA-carboxylase] ligase [Hydrogenimonas sp.]
MRIHSFDTLPSTQRWLVEKLARGEATSPCAVIAAMQTDGIGSRENRWVGKRGNFFASVALPEGMLPVDLPLSAASIYFAWRMKETLAEMGSEAWVKWPNDLYLEDRKIGGCITAKKGRTLVAGIGLNLVDAPLKFGVLDIRTDPETLLEAYLRRLEEPVTWKQIFSNYRLEFDRSRRFGVHIGPERMDLREAVLNEDGSLTIGSKRVVSQR